MATDVGITNGQNVDQSIINKALFSGASKLSCKVIWARIRYTGSAWEVNSGVDSAQLVSGNVAWSTDHINIALSGFTVAPVVLATPGYTSGAGNTRLPAVVNVSSTQAQIWFLTETLTLDSTQSTKMDCNVIIIGI